MPGTRKSSSPQRRYQQSVAAREMRREPTPAEDLLWQRLRRKQLGVCFRRQHSIDRFIVDFYCAEASLVVEIDGPIHDQPNADAERQAVLEGLGLRVLRVSNAETERAPDEVIARIVAHLDRPAGQVTDASPPPSPSPAEPERGT
ncbi:MAG: endonuclease domain-containing protein [Anaerolineae bacterium]|nr:endonuclease domain-containing protein [Anaerolineae bacterium]